MNKVVIAGTGHRPNKLGGYGQATSDRLYALAYDELAKLRPQKVISGMALGWDQALARAALDLEIPVVAAIPFKGQEKAWPLASQTAYWDILRRRDVEQVVVCEGEYASWKMMRRNEYMIDKCTAVLALWDGSHGGTSNAVFEAIRRKRYVENLWPKWVAKHNQAEIALAS